MLQFCSLRALSVKRVKRFKLRLQGLGIWWDFVFPGLMPFLVLAELMLAYGMVDAIGTLLHPLMHQVFRLPGSSGWALVQGWTVGSPSGAEAVSSLVKRGELSPKRGHLLLAMAHMPNPLFVLVVVGAGFLKQPMLGIYVLLVIWVSGLLSALLYSRFQTPSSSDEPNKIASAVNDRSASATESRKSLFSQAAAAMEEGRRRDGRTFGKALGDSVTSAVQKLLAVGGTIIFMSVILSLLKAIVPTSSGKLALTGAMESHIGAYAVSFSNTPAAMQTALLCVSIVLGRHKQSPASRRRCFWHWNEAAQPRRRKAYSCRNCLRVQSRSMAPTGVTSNCNDANFNDAS